MKRSLTQIVAQVKRKRSLQQIIASVAQKRGGTAPQPRPLAQVVQGATAACQVEPAPAQGRPQAEKRVLGGESVQHFVIRAGQRDAALQKASQLGVELVLSPVDPDSITHMYPPYEHTWFGSIGDYNGYHEARAKRLMAIARQYLRAVVRAPQPRERIVGMAQLEHGRPIFYAFPGETDPWTPERMDRIAFTHCDLCGIAHRRVKVFLVQRADGRIIQAGGQCAENLDLAKRVSNMLRAFKRFAAWAEQSEDEGFDLFRTGRTVYDPLTVLVLADSLIGQRGYVSGKDADETAGVWSTKAEVKELLENPRLESARLRILKESPRDRQALYDQAVQWAKDEQAREDSDFIRNTLTALETGSPRLLGWLVFAPEGVRRAHARALAHRRRQQQRARSFPWVPPIPWRATKVGRGVGRKQDYGDVLAQVSLEISPAKERSLVTAISPGDPLEVAYVVEVLTPMVAAARAPVRVLVARVRLPSRSEEHEQTTLHETSKVYLGYAAGDAFTEAMTAAKLVPAPTGADVIPLIAAHPQIRTWFKIGKRVQGKLQADPQAPVSKALAARLARYVPGAWTITRKREQEGFDYTTGRSYMIYHLSLMRPDGAQIYWPASNISVVDPPEGYAGSGYLEVGDTIQILGATVGTVRPAHPKFGSDGRRVSRVSWVLIA